MTADDEITERLAAAEQEVVIAQHELALAREDGTTELAALQPPDV